MYSEQGFSRGKRARSSTATQCPARARRSASALPAGPQPITRTSATGSIVTRFLGDDPVDIRPKLFGATGVARRGHQAVEEGLLVQLVRKTAAAFVEVHAQGLHVVGRQFAASERVQLLERHFAFGWQHD